MRRRTIVLLISVSFVSFGALHYFSPWGISFKGLICELLGLWALYRLLRLVSRPLKDQDATRSETPSPFVFLNLFRTFPEWNLFLLLGGVAAFFYPFSVTLRHIGFPCLLLLVVAWDGLLWAIHRHGLDIGTVTAIVGILVFTWIWEMAGRPNFIVLPVDAPQNQQNEFTAEGTANVLLTAIKTWPPQRELPLKPSLPSFNVTNSSEQAAELSQLQAWYERGVGSYPTLFEGLDASHIIGGAELGGVELAPVYHVLRHLRQKPVLEAQILVGKNNESLTLAIRRSNFPASCFSKDLPQRLREAIEGHNDSPVSGGATEVQAKDLVHRLYAVVEQDVQSPVGKVEPACNASWLRTKLAQYDFIDPPTLGDERVSNTTIIGLKGDERLTALIDRAVLAGMDKISPAHLAEYYEGVRHRESALDYFYKALPEALYEARRNENDAEKRRRVAAILARIGNLTDTPRNGNPVEAFEKGRKYYEAAIAFTPRDPLIYVREGSFILTTTRDLVRDDFLNSDASGKPKALVYYAAAAAAFARIIPDPSNWLEGVFLRSPRKDLEKRYGVDNVRELLSYSYGNLAYSEALQADITTDPAAKTRLLKLAKDHAESALNEQTEGGKEIRIRNTLIRRFVRVLSKEKEACKEGSWGFGRTLGNASTVEGILVVEDLYETIFRACDIQGTQANYHRFWLDYMHAWYHAGNRRYQQSSKALQDAIDIAERWLPGNKLLKSALLSLRGETSIEWSCDSEEELSTEERSKHRETGLMDLEHSIGLNEDNFNAKRAWARYKAASDQFDPKVSLKAETYATDAVQSDPSSPDANADLGAVLLRSGDLKSATDWFERAARIEHTDPQYYYLLGLALLLGGKVDRARNELEYGRWLDPERWSYIANPPSGCGLKFGQQRAALRRAQPHSTKGRGSISGSPR